MAALGRIDPSAALSGNVRYLRTPDGRTRRQAIIADREDGYLSLSWRSPMREPELAKMPIGIPLPDLTMDQFMELEDGGSTREGRV
jgi:hypothetical protein